MPTTEGRQRRLGRTLGWGLRVLVLTALVWALYRSLERFLEGRPEFAHDRFLLHLLLIAIVVMALALAGILVRHLVRLVVDQRHGLLGSRLRTKLVFFFLGLVLVPALVLFYGSTSIIRMSIDAMLRPDVEAATRELAQAVGSSLERQLLRQARSLAGELGSGGGAPDAAALDALREREALELLVLAGPGGVDVRADAEGLGEQGLSPEDLVAHVRPLVDRVRASGTADGDVLQLGDGVFAQAAVVVPGGGPRAVLAVGSFQGSALVTSFGHLGEAGRRYQLLRAQRRDLVRFYLSLTGLIFLVTVFVATWIGLYLSRRITGPLQELAAASREISTGNLGVRVQARAGDEVGTLVEAFNEMAARLQESREVITRGTAELRRSNEALEERRRYIETLLANLSTAVLSIDRHGRITTANPAASAILGVEPRPGDEILAALDAPGLGPLRELVQGALGRGLGEVRRDMTLSPPRGGTLAVSVQLSPLRGSHGDALGTLLMVEDLTDLLRAQRVAAWREVARRMAHEIKNPLTPIQLSAQRLRRKWEAGATDLAQVLPEATSAIEREVGALKRLVDEFSRFARMPEVVPEPVDFAQVVDSVLALYRGVPEIRFEVSTSPEVGLVAVDAEQMRRALINLIDNAISAMGGSGVVRIDVAPHTGPGTVRIQVSDTGPGIPPDDRDKLFVPYFSTKRRGTGLGLAIVHRVVTDHRGTIRVEDNAPRGARFVIEIPA